MKFPQHIESHLLDTKPCLTSQQHWQIEWQGTSSWQGFSKPLWGPPPLSCFLIAEMNQSSIDYNSDKLYRTFFGELVVQLVNYCGSWIYILNLLVLLLIWCHQVSDCSGAFWDPRCSASTRSDQESSPTKWSSCPAAPRVSAMWPTFHAHRGLQSHQNQPQISGHFS